MSSSTISSLRGLEGWPQEISWQDFEAAILESATEILLKPAREAQAIAAGFPVGRAFGASSELRWRRCADGWRFVLIHDQGNVLRGGELTSAGIAAKDEGQYILWGERESDASSFREGRIPRILDEYAPWAAGVKSGGRMALVFKTYETGRGLLERYVRIEPFRGPER